MCKLVCEKYCKPLVRDGKPWRLFSDFPTKLEEPDRPGFVKIFRGIHDVIVPNLEHPGSWWSFSPAVAAQRYAEPSVFLYQHGVGTVLAGHVLGAEVSLDYSDVKNAHDSFRSLQKGQQIELPTLDLHQVFVPKGDFNVLEKIENLSARVYLVQGNGTTNDYYD